MRIMYLDCTMGVAGDMLMAALSELSNAPFEFIKTINHFGIPGISVKAEKLSRRGTAGTHIKVLWNGMEEQSFEFQHGKHPADYRGEKKPNHPVEIESLLKSLPLPYSIIENAIAVLRLIFEAESYVHGIDMSDIHDSRLGTMDSIIDVLGCCMLIQEINPEKILASPIHAGFGHIHCRRGILPVPAPATEYLLRGIPYYSGDIQGEFCTPTGAALIRHFVDAFAPMQDVMGVIKTGCGIGSKDYGIPGGLCVHYYNNFAVSKFHKICYNY